MTEDSQRRHADKIRVERVLERQTGLNQTQVRDGLRQFAKDVQAQQAVAAIPGAGGTAPPPTQHHSDITMTPLPQAAPRGPQQKDPTVQAVTVTVTGALNGVPGVGYAYYLCAPIPV